MTIDASIPLGAKTDYGNPLDTAAKALTLKHLMTLDANAPMQAQAEALKLQGAQLDVNAKQKDVIKQQKIQQAFQDSIDPLTSKLDKPKVIGLISQFAGEDAIKLGSEWAKTDDEFRKGMQESQKNFIGLAGPTFKSVTDKYDAQIKSGVPADVAEANIRPTVGAAIEMFKQNGFGSEFHGDPNAVTIDQLRAIASQWGEGMKIDARAAGSENQGRMLDMQGRRLDLQERRLHDAENNPGGASGTDKPPTGYRWNADHTALAAIPGGPVDPTNAVPSEVSNLHGDDYLAAIEPGQRELIKGVSAGQIPLSQLSTRGGHRERIAAQALQHDPTFTANRFNVIKDFTTGPAANNVTAINTAIGHLGSLNELGDALKNGDTPLMNKLFNRIATETGHAEVNNFDVARGAVGDELMRVFRQVGASERESQDWSDKFAASKSPEQLKGAAKTAATLLGSRIEALNDKFMRGTGKKTGFPNLLSPHSQDVMGAISGHKYDDEGNRIKDESQAAPAAANSHPGDVTDLLDKYR